MTAGFEEPGFGGDENVECGFRALKGLLEFQWSVNRLAVAISGLHVLMSHR